MSLYNFKALTLSLFQKYEFTLVFFVKVILNLHLYSCRTIHIYEFTKDI